MERSITIAWRVSPLIMLDYPVEATRRFRRHKGVLKNSENCERRLWKQDRCCRRSSWNSDYCSSAKCWRWVIPRRNELRVKENINRWLEKSEYAGKDSMGSSPLPISIVSPSSVPIMSASVQQHTAYSDLFFFTACERISRMCGFRNDKLLDHLERSLYDKLLTLLKICCYTRTMFRWSWISLGTRSSG